LNSVVRLGLLYVFTDACISEIPTKCRRLFAAACIATLLARAEAHVTKASVAVEIVLLECSQVSPAIHLVTAAGHDLVPTRAVGMSSIGDTTVDCSAGELRA